MKPRSPHGPPLTAVARNNGVAGFRRYDALERQYILTLEGELELYRHRFFRNGRETADSAIQDAIGFAASCLYGLSEAVILAAGYSPAIGFIHSGNQRSLVFDLADTVKFKTVIPAAFEVVREGRQDVRNRVRRRCRDLFREQKTAETLFANLLEVFDVAGATDKKT